MAGGAFSQLPMGRWEFFFYFIAHDCSPLTSVRRSRNASRSDNLYLTSLPTLMIGNPYRLLHAHTASVPSVIPRNSAASFRFKRCEFFSMVCFNFFSYNKCKPRSFFIIRRRRRVFKVHSLANVCVFLYAHENHRTCMWGI